MDHGVETKKLCGDVMRPYKLIANVTMLRTEDREL